MPDRLPARAGFLSAVGLMVGASACGPPPVAPEPEGAVRSRSLAERSLALEWPPDEFLVGVGRSKEGPAAARAAAKGEVCAQISSRIQDRLVAVESETGGVAGGHVERRVEQWATCERAELIETPAESLRCAGESCEALAVLNRARAVAALREDFDTARAAFRAAAERAQSAASIGGFTVAFREAQSRAAEARAAAVPLEALAGRPPRELEGLRTTEAALFQARDGRLSGLHVAVDAAGVSPAELRGPAAAGLVAALGALGVRASVAEGCQGHRVVVAGTLACGAGAIGPRCELALRGTLADCPSGAESVSFAVRAVGAHPRSEADARRQLESRLGGDALAGELRTALSPVLPVR